MMHECLNVYSSKSLVRSTSVFLLIGFIALMGIVAVIFWLGERAQSDFDDAISARDTRIAAVELRNAVADRRGKPAGVASEAAKIQARRHLSLSWPDQVTAFYGLPFPLAAQSESCEQKMLVDVATEPPVLPALEGWTVSERIDALDRKPTFRFVHIGKALA
jgi:hypothetical protein